MRLDTIMQEADFSHAMRAGEVPALVRIQQENEGKERITVRLDADVLAWFRERVKGGGNYQTLINAALRVHIEEQEGVLERVLRRVSREDLRQEALHPASLQT